MKRIEPADDVMATTTTTTQQKSPDRLGTSALTRAATPDVPENSEGKPHAWP